MFEAVNVKKIEVSWTFSKCTLFSWLFFHHAKLSGMGTSTALKLF